MTAVRKRLLFGAVAACLLFTSVQTPAQFKVRPVAEQGGHVALGLLLRQLDNVGIFMMTTAHPDDENNALLAKLRHGEGVRTVLVTATRGDGGQNEIGPELFDALAVLRTEELLAAHRFDGAEQYFTRAVDFGYSFSIEETYDRWGKEEILGDFVRHIRTIRPDVIVGFLFEGQGGGQHHQASARLTAEAFRAAADPERFPEQIAEGLRPWQAKKYYYTAGFGPAPGAPGPDTVLADASVYDALLGRTYERIGSEARSMHKCQGMPQLLALPGAAGRQYRLHDTVLDGVPPDAPMFAGIDTGLTSLAQYAAPDPPLRLTEALAEIASSVAVARDALHTGGPAAAGAPVLEGLQATRTLRANLAALPLSDEARYEIAHRLDTKLAQFEEAVLVAHGIQLHLLADDGVVTPGQPVSVSLVASNQGPQAVGVKGISFSGLHGEGTGCATGAIASAGVFRCTAEVVVPSEAPLTGIHFSRLPDFARYEFDQDVPFGVPFRPTPFRAAITLGFPSGLDIIVHRPVEYRYERDIFSGEKRMELKVVPAFAVSVSPEIAIFPAVRGTGPTARLGAPESTAALQATPNREVRVTVVNASTGAASGQVRLELPAGWRSTPASAPVSFSREDESQTVRFSVEPAAGAPPGEYRLRAIVSAEGREYDRGFQAVEYPHIQRRHLIHDAAAIMKVIDLQVAPGLAVGYVLGVGDRVPQAIEQLGVRLEMIDADQLAWGDLSRYDTLVTGVRAYESRDDLRANNHRLLQYVENGGTLIVQYNRLQFNEAQYAPYPAEVGRDRITDADAPVDVLVPDHPVFNFPNRIGGEAWEGWVQERGLYFLGNRDERFEDLVQMEDPWEYNPGIKQGALVEARYGQGRWIYIGLGLWRQLPAGTPGAYQLMANLLSLSRAEARDEQQP